MRMHFIGLDTRGSWFSFRALSFPPLRTRLRLALFCLRHQKVDNSPGRREIRRLKSWAVQQSASASSLFAAMIRAEKSGREPDQISSWVGSYYSRTPLAADRLRLGEA